MTNAKTSSPSPHPSPTRGEGETCQTPMMTQYMAVKREHVDCLLFYRMGDFYEMFFDDAVTASKILDLTLTRRGKAHGEDIPMCGVPFHASESYIARLIKAGQKVAICEQVETPQQAKERGGYKALVRREVIRVITPGTIIEDSLLNAKTNNYLASCVEMNGVTGLAFADVSTGEFCLQSLNDKDIKSTLHRLSPSELIYPDIPNLAPEITTGGTPRPQGFFDSADGLLRIKTLFGLTEEDLLTKFSRAEIAAAGALLNYVDETQKGATPYLSSPRKADDFKAVDIDSSTFRSLEIVKTQTGERSGSLIDLLDRAETGAGSRLLQSRMTSPIQDVMEINRRLDEIETCITNFDLTKKIKTTLKSVPDMERALARISLGRGGPRDLAALRDGLYYAALIRSALIERGLLETALSQIGHKLKLSDDIAKFKETLESALAENLPLLSRDGGFVASGYSPELDNLRALKSETQRHIANLQTKYVQDTGIETLKITHNNILGFFIEVPARRADAMMVKAGTNDNPFIHRQTLSTGVRFTTPDLSNLERDIALSAEKALALEENMFQEFSNTARTLAHEISMIAQGLAAIDVATAMADLAVDKGYKRPIIDNSTAFFIQRGRHPSVEYALQKKYTQFIPNDCHLEDNQKLWLLTGPNMAGKSTFLRQNALIAIMAQSGFYVPAEIAHIGVADKIFSRVGASDDLARGHSTFMIEMVETASILQNATAKSLVILDEIGRGTSTYDGMSIAWATLEYLHHSSQCRGLFATHYHELTELDKQLPHLACYTMDIKDWQGEIVFLHKVKAGTADRSYGIHVAKLAGIPEAVINRAKSILEVLETGKAKGNKTLSAELPLFQANITPSKKQTSPVEDKLKTISPDSLTPREALDLIYSLKTLL